MAGDSVVVKTRKFMKNPLLSRRQVRLNDEGLIVPSILSIIASSLCRATRLFNAESLTSAN